MPGHNYAYQPEFQRVLQLVQRGELGTVRAMWVIYALKHDEDLAARYSGVLDEVMVHHAYWTYAALGRPARVFAGRAEPAWRSLSTDDQAWMVWEYPPRGVAHLFASFAVDDDTAESLDLCSQGARDQWRRHILLEERDVGWRGGRSAPVPPGLLRGVLRTRATGVLEGSARWRRQIGSVADGGRAGGRRPNVPARCCYVKH